MGIKKPIILRGDAVNCITICWEVFGRMVYVDLGFRARAYRYERLINGDVILF